MIFRKILGIFALLFGSLLRAEGSKLLVLQSDFGTADGAVAAMKGVAMSIDTSLKIFDLTHDIPPFDIWTAMHRLYQTVAYWPAGTVFVSVVDPGVGSERRSVVLKTNTGHYIVSPDNGTLTLVAQHLGVAEVREIEETTNRRQQQGSHTFDGRDLYVYTGARLAAGIISFAQVGRVVKGEIVRLAYETPYIAEGKIKGCLGATDLRFGNIWTNIDKKWLAELGITVSDTLEVSFYHKALKITTLLLPYVATFSDVGSGHPLAYLNSIFTLAFAVNQGSFEQRYGITNPAQWRVSVAKYRRSKRN